MTILMITPYLPYPLYSGGQIRTYHLLKYLAKKHDITLFSFIRNDNERQSVAHLQQFCKKVVVFKRRRAWSLVNILFAAFSFFPFLVAIYYSLGLKRAIQQELAQGKYDLIHAETFYVMPNIPKTTVPILLVEQTIEFQVYQHFVEKNPPFFLRPLLYFDVWKIKFWEERFWKKAERVVAMSEADRRVMRQVVSDRDVDLVPNGVDLTFFRFPVHDNRAARTILFVGNFNWLQNREAVLYLAKHVWPEIEQRTPKARLLIVGRNPSRDIMRLASASILVRGDVEDIRTAYRDASVLVAPMLGRGGTRYKILEAMATGVPVVSTPIGIEGIEAADEEEVLVRRDPSTISEAVAALLTDKELYSRIRKNARLLIEKKYSWDRIAATLDGLYEQVGHV
ncbi:MAG: glycosyltransferase family 4 protein [bacterium]|nr:glycosyltransferase family 4 protein [bacterium]